ncbi:DNA helicase/exodeoxyribonuclease V, subunit B [Anaerocolumna jejuensis DSM 15929]|uniref:DNA helicase/exodeoxyribonuclease V, subunit B n=1 Tax=Anaerocolumna jejuensis DSM 15929 TaxID=1121322 RepID=A0A1M6VGC9_9FIRM|nr:helicase-exonuclease AddAB subunit AddB [Anaerocolumna jejuensis]SHK80518.1 DNA helicase/exodeoxyribonuclease V, subunit B [Anaerocolumna jejuensis DSM 15929]
MSLKFIMGRSGSGKSYRLYHEIIEKSMEYPDSGYLVLVPEQFTLQTQKDIVTMHPLKGTMNIDILSFMRLAYRIFDETGKDNRKVLEDTGKTMVLRKLVANKKEELRFFSHDVNKQGFAEELKSLISEICQYSIRMEDLDRVSASLLGKERLKDKLHDVKVIYEAFQEYMENNYITAEEILEALIPSIGRSELIKGSIICLDGFTGFTPSQYRLLTELMKYARMVIVTVTIGKDELREKDEPYKLFHLSRRTVDKLSKIAGEENIPLEETLFMEDCFKEKIPRRYLKNKELAALEENIFRYRIHTFDEPAKNIVLYGARNIENEVNSIICNIKTLVREKGYRYQEIAVVTGDIASYGRELKKGFEREGIPFFLDSKRDSMSNPFVELIRCALMIVYDNFSYEGVFGYLRTGLTGIEREDIDLLENYVLALGIRGKKRWEEPFSRLSRRTPEGDLTRINEARKKFCDTFLPFYEVLSNKSLTVTDYTKALYELGIRLEAPGQLADFAEEFLKENRLSEEKEYRQVYATVIALYDKLVELLGEERMPPREYAQVLEAGLREAKVGLIPPGLDQIVIGDIERTRLKDIKILFFAGVNDGNIPKKPSKGLILNDGDREVLEREKVELAPTGKQEIYTERFYLYLNLTKPKDMLYITFSKLSEDGKKLLPAYLISDIRKIFPALTVKEEEEERDAVSDILSIKEGLDYLIEGLRNFPDSREDLLWQELFQYYYREEEKRKELLRLVRAVFYIDEEKGLQKKAARELYGEKLAGSVTRFEKFAECAFAHFAAYGLELSEREEYRLSAPDIGNIFHKALELFSRKIKDSEYNWHTIPDEVRESLGDICVEEAVKDYGNLIFTSTKRYEAIVRRAKRILNRTLWAVCRQIRKGDFEPEAFELYFSDRTSLDTLTIPVSPEESISLTGRIDRLDTYEEGDKLFLRVVDYKSGSVSFDLNSLYYGLQIQLAFYLGAAMELFYKDRKDKEVLPAGILYYNMEDPMVDRSEDVEESILKALKMNGIVNSDHDIVKHQDKSFETGGEGIRPSVRSDVIPVESNKEGELTKRSQGASTEEILLLLSHVRTMVGEMGKHILDGSTGAKPYKMANRTACDYCPYKDVCGFDTKLKSFEYKKLKILEKEELIRRMRKGGEKEDGVDQGTEEGHRDEE